MLQKYLSRVAPGILTSVVTLAILWLTLAPHPLPAADIPLFEGADKVVHALMFGGLVFAMLFDVELFNNRRYQLTGRMPSAKKLPTLLCAAVSATIFGAAIEWLQGFMEMGRGCDIYDLMADAAGAAVSAALSPFVIARLLQRR